MAYDALETELRQVPCKNWHTVGASVHISTLPSHRVPSAGMSLVHVYGSGWACWQGLYVQERLPGLQAFGSQSLLPDLLRRKCQPCGKATGRQP